MCICTMKEKGLTLSLLKLGLEVGRGDREPPFPQL
jgi:hypothetical protein